MRALGIVLSLALAGGVSGQAVHRSFGSVVFPGGTSSTNPGITRNFGSVVFPGGMRMQPVPGGAPVIGARPGVGGGAFVSPGRGYNSNPGRSSGHGRGPRTSFPYVYGYPIYVGGYDNSYVPEEAAVPPPQQPQQQQPNVTVIYPPQQATPFMIQAGPDGSYSVVPRQPATIYEPQRRYESPEEPAPSAEPNRYLLALKDHTIYTIVAYWADGDTLHYFTSGNTHNQASMSLIDRELTDRLNREMGIDFKLPLAK